MFNVRISLSSAVQVSSLATAVVPYFEQSKTNLAGTKHRALLQEASSSPESQSRDARGKAEDSHGTLTLSGSMTIRSKDSRSRNKGRTRGTGGTKIA
jgi:hypothetical protein